MRVAALALVVGCRAPDPGRGAARDTGADAAGYGPLLAVPALRDVATARRSEPPFDAVWQVIVDKSEEELRDPDPGTWDHSAHGHNARIAQAAALRAWLDGDAEAAGRARAALDRVEADLGRSDDWDLNIRLPRTVTCSANAVDLLLAAGFATPEEAATWNGVISDIGEEAYEMYVLDDAMRQIALGFSQNNHPLRTASAIGYAALADPDAPGATERLDWALSEYAYLLGPDGRYIQPDGVVSEGPHYYAFGLGAVLSFLIGVDHRLPADRVVVRDCVNRQDVDPWEGHGCIDGDEFVLSSPIRDPLLHATAEWSVSQRLPTGHRPPQADSYLVSVNGLPLLTHYGAPDHLMWDWIDNADAPLELDNAKTAHASSHNVLLIDGEGAPDKGLLTNWGDADAFLENPVLGEDVAWAEARMAFAGAELVRGAALLRGRYFVVVDAVSTDVESEREHRFRLHLNAGFDAGGELWFTDAGPGLARDSGALQVYLGSTAGPVSFDEPAHTPLTAPHVHLFDGDREPRDHAVVDGVVSARAPGFLAVLAPWRLGEEVGADAPLQVDAVEAGPGAVAWRVRGVDEDGGAFDDLVWTRAADAPGRLEVGGVVVETDARFLWTSLTGATGLVSRGSRVDIDGVEVLVEATDGVVEF